MTKSSFFSSLNLYTDSLSSNSIDDQIKYFNNITAKLLTEFYSIKMKNNFADISEMSDKKEIRLFYNICAHAVLWQPQKKDINFTEVRTFCDRIIKFHSCFNAKNASFPTELADFTEYLRTMSNATKQILYPCFMLAFAEIIMNDKYTKKMQLMGISNTEIFDLYYYLAAGNNINAIKKLIFIANDLSINIEDYLKFKKISKLKFLNKLYNHQNTLYTYLIEIIKKDSIDAVICAKNMFIPIAQYVDKENKDLYYKLVEVLHHLSKEWQVPNVSVFLEVVSINFPQIKTDADARVDLLAVNNFIKQHSRWVSAFAAVSKHSIRDMNLPIDVMSLVFDKMPKTIQNVGEIPECFTYRSIKYLDRIQQHKYK